MRFLGVLLVVASVGLGTERLHAGAWPTGKGNGFASINQVFAQTDTGFVADLTSGYLEYGIGSKLTLGGKYDRLVLGGTTVLGFARWHLAAPDAPVQIALQAGAGHVSEPDGTDDTIISAAAFLGRGLNTPLGPGWAELELRVSRKTAIGATWGNLDFTLGISPTDTSHLILQTRLFADRQSTDVEIVPAYVRQIFPNLKARVGLNYSLGADQAIGIELGTWLTF